MNILIHIDSSWSYHFFEFNKPAISTLDFFEFIDTFYSSAMLYLQTHVNHRFGLRAPEYNDGINGSMQICNKYPELAEKISQAFRDLHHRHRPSLGALQGPITKIQTICDDTGILTAIVVTIDIRSSLTPILHL
jgi:hypothetical protein